MNINKSKEQIQVLILIGIVLVIAYVTLYMFLLKPQLKKAGVLKKDISELMRKVKSTKRQLNRLDGLSKKIIDAEKKIEDFQMLMPKGDESWSIEQLDQVAKKHGVIIKKIQPDLGGGQKSYFVNNHKYDTRAITVDVRCGYHTFGEFINVLERSSPFLKIANINITKGEKPDYMHKITFSVIYLVLKEYE